MRAVEKNHSKVVHAQNGQDMHRFTRSESTGENGSVTPKNRLFHGIHIPYYYCYIYKKLFSLPAAHCQNEPLGSGSFSQKFETKVSRKNENSSLTPNSHSM